MTLSDSHPLPASLQQQQLLGSKQDPLRAPNTQTTADGHQPTVNDAQPVLDMTPTPLLPSKSYTGLIEKKQ
jgi:hypothetical protein